MLGKVAIMRNGRLLLNDDGTVRLVDAETVKAGDIICTKEGEALRHGSSRNRRVRVSVSAKG